MGSDTDNYFNRLSLKGNKEMEEVENMENNMFVRL